MPARDESPGPAALAEESDTEELLTFRLGSAEYGLPIFVVKELRAWQPVTRIPFAKAWEYGLMNLRGAVVPVFDLRVRAGLTRTKYTKHTVVMVFITEHEGRECLRGAVVDELLDVLQVPADQIKAPSELPANRCLEFASRMVEYEGRIIFILDLTKAFSLRAPLCQKSCSN